MQCVCGSFISVLPLLRRCVWCFYFLFWVLFVDSGCPSFFWVVKWFSSWIWIYTYFVDENFDGHLFHGHLSVFFRFSHIQVGLCLKFLFKFITNISSIIYYAKLKTEMWKRNCFCCLIVGTKTHFTTQKNDGQPLSTKRTQNKK